MTKRVRRISYRSAMLAGLLVAALAAPAAAESVLQREPTAADLKKHPILAKLRKSVSASFVDTPFESAIDQLQRRTGVTMVLDRRFLRRRVRVPVDLIMEDAPAREVLYWTLRLADVDFEIRGQVLFISTHARLMHRHLQTKIYNILDLTIKPSHFPGPETGLAEYHQVYAGGPIISEPAEETLSAGNYAELIQTRIAPDTWSTELGTSIEERGGMLIVKQRADVHRRIEAFLKVMRDQTGKMVAFHMRAIRVASSAMAGVIGLEGRSHYLTAAERKKIDDLVRDKRAELISTVRITCHSNQRIHAFSGGQKSIVADYDISGTVFDPDIRPVLSGVTFDVMPRVSQDNRHIMMELRMSVTTLRETESFYPIGGPGPDEKGAKKPAAAATATRTSLAPGAVQLPSLDHSRMHTTVQVPTGETIVFTMEDPTNDDAAAPREILLIVTPTVVTF